MDLDLKTDKLGPIIDVVKKTKTEDIVFYFDSDYNALHFVDKVDKKYMLMPGHIRKPWLIRPLRSSNPK